MTISGGGGIKSLVLKKSEYKKMQNLTSDSDFKQAFARNDHLTLSDSLDQQVLLSAANDSQMPATLFTLAACIDHVQPLTQNEVTR